MWATPTSTGVSVNEDSALNYGPVWACVNRVGSDTASAALLLYKRLKGGGKERYTDSHLYELLHDSPNEEMSAFNFRKALTAHVLTWGNGYAEIIRNGAGAVSSLELITPNRVCVKRDQRTRKIYYEVAREDGGGFDYLHRHEMFHLSGLSFDGLVGYSVISRMREAIALGLATERFGGSFFGQGATIGGVISLKTDLTPQSRESFRQAMAAQHQGVARAHGFLLLGNEATYQKLGIPPNDAQFLETRQFEASEIAMWFGVPPHKIGILDRSTNNNIAHQDLEYYINTLRPIYRLWEQEVWMKLIPRLERKIQFVEHLQDSRYSADIQTRYDAYAVGRTNGWLSADDIRELENMNPLPDGQGKFYLVPLNTVPANRLEEVIDKQVEPNPPQAAPTAAPREEKDDSERMREIVEQIRTELSTVHTSLRDKVDELAKVTATSSQFDDFSDLFRKSVDALSAEIAEYRNKESVLSALLIEATQKADRIQLEKEAERIKAEEDARLVREQAHQEKEVLRAETAAEVERLNGLLSDATTRTQELRTAHADAQRKAEELEDGLASAQARMRETSDASSENRREAEESIARLTRELDEAIGIAEARAQEMSEAKADVGGLRRQIAELEAARASDLAIQAETVATLAEQERAHAQAQAQLVELQAAIEKTKRELGDLAAERDTVKTTAETAEQRAEAAHRAMQDATAQLAKVTDDATAASQRLAEETARVAAEREAHAKTRATYADRKQAEIAAHRGLVSDAMARLTWRETERGRKNKGTPEKLKAWAESFYLLHEETCIDALRSVMRTHLAFIGSTEDVDAYTRAKIHPQIEAALEQIRAVANGDPDDFPTAIEQLFTRWERERPAALADLILQEEVAYVRSL